MNKEILTRTECNILRGIAIIGIFLHNYCHWLNPIVKENEYQYFQHNVDWLHQVMGNPDMLLPMHLLSFFGHYGVPVFLFLSAYGLERKYEPKPQNPDNTCGIISFIRKHFMKLFKMMIIGFAAFIMVDAMTPGSWHYDVLKIVAQLGLFNNLLSDPDKQIWPGPYWFFGLMLQLYIVYRLFIYHRHIAWTIGLMAVCMGIQFCFGAESAELNWYRYNFMGGMLPFGLGIILARYGGLFANAKYLYHWCNLLIMTILSFLLSYDEYTWSLVPAVICIGSVSLAKIVTHYVCLSWLASSLDWTGLISAALFVCHPITRKIFIPISRQGDIYTGLLLYIVASLCLAWVFKLLMDRINRKKAWSLK